MDNNIKSDTPANYLGQVKNILSTYWFVILSFAVMLLSQSHLLGYFWHTWNIKDYYYSHGPIVPVLVGWMVYVNRNRLKECDFRSSLPGFVLILLSAALYLSGVATGYEEICIAGFFTAIFGLLLVLFGKCVTWILALPVLFMVTMAPLPEIVLDSGTGHYQIISTTLATRTLQLVGVEVRQQGNTIVSSDLPEPLLIAGACSGLRLLISLITLTWLFAYMLEGAWWKKVLLLASSLPLSMLVNAIRIVLIAVVGISTYSSTAIHKFHDYSGYISLLLCFVLVGVLCRLMGIKYFRQFEPANPEKVAAFRPKKSLGLNVVSGLSVVVFGLVIMFSSMISGLYELPKGQIESSMIPESMGSWISTPVVIDEFSIKQLNMADLRSYNYINVAQDLPGVQLFVSRSYDVAMFHNPYLCLPGSGTRITRARQLQIDTGSATPSVITGSFLNFTGDGQDGIMFHWYEVEGRSIPSKTALDTYAFSTRMHDLERLVLSPGQLHQIKDSIRGRQITWYRITTSARTDAQDIELVKAFVKKLKSMQKL